MSRKLLDYAKQFTDRSVPVDAFVDTYIAMWKQERDDDTLPPDPDDLGLMLSSIFIAADAYAPDDDRLEHELDEASLRAEIRDHIARYEA